MENKKVKSECRSTIDVATFNKLVTDNECLKQRVEALEKSLQDALREIFTLQRQISSNGCKFSEASGSNSNDGCTVRYRDRSPEHSSKRRHESLHRSLEYSSSSRQSNKNERTDNERRRNESQTSGQPVHFEHSKNRYRSTERFAPHRSSAREYPFKYCRAEQNVSAVRNRGHVKRRLSPSGREFRKDTPPNLYRESGDEHVRNGSPSRRSSSSEHLSRRKGVIGKSIYERPSADSSAAGKNHEQNIEYSEKTSAFDERTRNDHGKHSHHRLDRSDEQLSDRRARETGASNHLHCGRHTECKLPPNENREMMRRLQNRCLVKVPESTDDCSAKIANDSQQFRRVSEIGETKETSQPLKCGKLVSGRQTISVNGAQRKVLENPMITEKVVRNPSAEKVETVESNEPSLHKITLWTDLGKLESTVGSEFLSRVHSTPMKLIDHFVNYKMVSPLQNTPNQLKDGESKNLKINLTPYLLLNTCHENTENKTSKDVEMKPALPQEIVSALPLHKDRIPSGARDNVEIQTVIKTNEAEHGVFKRQKRTF